MLIQNPARKRSKTADLISEAFLDFKFRLDPLVGHRRIIKKTARRLGYIPDVKSPTTYNEKILWRKLFDRNPVQTKVSDKVTVRTFIEERLGSNLAGSLLTTVYDICKSPQELDFEKYPESYVVKANHASGWNIFVSPENPLDEECLRAEAELWMRRSYGKNKHEWAYQSIPRRILVEEMVLNQSGSVANDIKFAVFNGKCQFIVYCDDRFGDHCWHHLSPDWTRLFSTPVSANSKPLPPKPPKVEHMLHIAEKISQGFDFFRVDFLFTENRQLLNEITLYDASGMDPLDPPIWDKKFGEFWTLPDSI